MTMNKYERQQEIVDRDRIAGKFVTIIGVGSIGRQVALMLAAMGFNLELIDPDIVEEVNIAVQGYSYYDIGRSKVIITREDCLRAHKETEIGTSIKKFKRAHCAEPIPWVFCCVDSIAARAHIWKLLNKDVRFFVDGRMTAESMRIITASSSKSKKYYPKTLFSAKEAQGGSCTAKSTFYCASVAAGLMIANFTKYLRNIPVEKDIMLNVLSSELLIYEEPDNG